jgi:hypothetical protein
MWFFSGSVVDERWAQVTAHGELACLAGNRLTAGRLTLRNDLLHVLGVGGVGRLLHDV